MKKSGGTPWYWFIAGLVRKVIFPILGGVSVRGRENIPDSGALLVTPIHLSHIDPPLIGCICTRALRYMAKKELFTFWLGPLIRSLGAFPVSRGDGDSSAIRTALEELNECNALVIFPEGRRGDAQHIQKLEPGVMMLAKRSSAAVLPVGISGSQRMLPKGSFFPKRHRVTVVFGEPFYYQDFVQEGRSDKETRELFMTELAHRIVVACKEAGLDLGATPTPKSVSEQSSQTSDSPHESST